MTLTKYSYLFVTKHHLMFTKSILLALVDNTCYRLKNLNEDYFLIVHKCCSTSSKMNPLNSMVLKRKTDNDSTKSCKNSDRIPNSAADDSSICNKRKSCNKIFRNLILKQINDKLKKIVTHGVDDSNIYKRYVSNREYLLHVPDNSNGNSGLKSLLYSVSDEKLFNSWIFSKEYLNVSGKKRKFKSSSGSTGDKTSTMETQLCGKQLFNLNMFLKYQYPSFHQAILLENMFPDAEKLVGETVTPLVSAGVMPSLSEYVSNHLGGFYWKTTLTLPWPQKITVTGMHMVKDESRKRAYLLLCESLKNNGLVSLRASGQWRPLRCEQVLEMLEQLAKYGRIGIKNARGRGFKVLLQQVKDQRDNGGCSLGTSTTLDVNVVEFHCLEKASDPQGTSRTVENAEEMVKTVEEDDIACDLSENFEHFDSANTYKDKDDQMVFERDLKWKCSVHVGWPKPFSVYSYGLSLPSTQLLGLMATAAKLKRQSLLTKCNSGICGKMLTRIVEKETASLWREQIHHVFNSNRGDFEADAEIFCDASYQGMGAYLVQKDNEKISWMSEQWQDLPEVSQELNISTEKRNLIHSQQAEIVAMLTAIFTWKKKLKHKKVLVFSDNSIAAGVLNTFTSLDLRNDSKDVISNTFNTIHNIYNIKLKAVWIDRSQNQLADQLSRQDYFIFHKVFPTASKYKTKAKRISFRFN